MSWEEWHIPILSASGRLHWARGSAIGGGGWRPAICSKYNRGVRGVSQGQPDMRPDWATGRAFESATWCKHCTRMAEKGRQS